MPHYRDDLEEVLPAPRFTLVHGIGALALASLLTGVITYLVIQGHRDVASRLANDARIDEERAQALTKRQADEAEAERTRPAREAERKKREAEAQASREVADAEAEKVRLARQTEAAERAERAETRRREQAAEARAAARIKNDKIEVWVAAQGIIKQRLKAPSTADFGGIFGDYQDPRDCVTRQGTNLFSVQGWVDAQNAFGAKVRSDFSLKIRYDPDKETWFGSEILIVNR